MTGIRWGGVPALWVGLLGGPVAWAVHVQAVYALASWACHGVSPVLLHLVAATCLLSAAGAGWVAWRNWHAIGGWPSDVDVPEIGRTRLMALLGVMTGTLFAIVIFAQWVAVMTLDPCSPPTQVP